MQRSIPPETNTPDWLRSFPGCEHYSDEEAKEAIAAIKVVAPTLLKIATELLQAEDKPNPPHKTT